MDTMWKQLCALTVTNSVFIHLHPLYAIDCTDETKKKLISCESLQMPPACMCVCVCLCVGGAIG